MQSLIYILVLPPSSLWLGRSANVIRIRGIIPGVRVVAYAWGLALLLVLLLTGRWPWVRIPYAVALALIGLVGLISGDAVPRRLTTAPRLSAAYRLGGTVLIAFAAVVLVGLAPGHHQPWQVALEGICTAVLLAAGILVYRHPELIPFRNTLEAQRNQGS